MQVSLSHILAIILSAITLLLLYLAWEVHPDFSKGLIPSLFLLAVVFFSSPQINWWYWQRNPPDLRLGMAQAIEKYVPFYQKLDEDGRRKFRSRVFMFMEGTDWLAKGFPDDESELPKDLQLIFASQVAQLTFHRDGFLLKKFEKVVVYPKPFLSPLRPEPHNSETFEPDGCLIFSAEAVMKAFVKPFENYNPALHEYAVATNLEWGGELADACRKWSGNLENWQILEKISGFSLQKIQETLGSESVELMPVAVHHYFVFPENMKKEWQEMTTALDEVFQKKMGI